MKTLKNFEVSFKVYSEYTTKVKASSKEEAIKKARPKYESSDMGEFNFIDEICVEAYEN